MVTTLLELPPDGLHGAQELAQLAGLRYVCDTTPGLCRKKRGRGFAYFSPAGELIADARLRARIDALAIPPAWTDVWNCPHADGHLQATGRDARARKQYRYHARWSEISNQTKFERMLAFGETLPLIRRQVQSDLLARNYGRSKVVAAIIEIMDRTLIRVGSKEYASENESFGLTTLMDEHVEIRGGSVVFRFRGKGGKEHHIRLRDRRLARIVQRCEEIPGQELFQFRNEGGLYVPVESTDVNRYLREVTSQCFTAKDFRTWHGTAVATGFLVEAASAESPASAKTVINEAIRRASEALGNTRTVCRKYYVHPRVCDLYTDGALHTLHRAYRRRKHPGLRAGEGFLLHLLRHISAS